MTMGFVWGRDGRVKEIAVGDEVAFSFHKEDSAYMLDSIERKGARP